MKACHYFIITLEEFEVEPFTANQKTVLASALQHYGRDKQIIKAIEEMGELIQVLAKHLHAGERSLGKMHSDIAGEIADVEITLAQVKKLIGVQALVSIHRDYKIVRLKNRIKKEKGEVPTILETI